MAENIQRGEGNDVGIDCFIVCIYYNSHAYILKT